MDLTLSTCFVVVDDPDAAVGFYRDALGLEVRQDVPQDQLRWITVGSPAQPGVGIVLTNYLNTGPADRDTVRALVDQGALAGVHFQAADLDAAFAQARGAGAEVVQEPAEQPWGARDFAVRDPAGNMVRVAQAPGA
jgi:catechol 2,3-dioxygenase-like lactoylglutathione lyase family enzyme